MAKKRDEDYDDVEENPVTLEGRDIPPWIAGIGTYSVLTIYNKLAQWLFSFMDLPPWAILARDVTLAGSNVALGELLGRKLMKGSTPEEQSSVDLAIRFGYIASSLQTLGTGIYQAVVKKKGMTSSQLQKAKSLEDAKKIWEAALEEQRSVNAKVDAARTQYNELAAQQDQKQLPAPQDQQQPAQQQQQAGHTGQIPPFSNRLGRQTKKAILSGLG